MLLRGRYRVRSRVGAGAMGTVYEVEDRLAGGAVRALKALWPGDGGDALVATLRSEFAVLARLRHPLLCRVHDFGRLPADAKLAGAPGQGGYFLTRDLVDGVDLGAAAVAAGRDLGAICRLLAAAARGLEALHQAGLRHGDFKPGNAIAAGGQVRLIDFGLTAKESSARTAGTPVYMAPELRAGRPADRRADLYAVGVTLCELATGRLPFGDGARGQGGGARPRLSELGAGSDVADPLLLRCLALDPDDRIASAAELAAGLDACADELGAAPGIEAGLGEGAVPPVVSGAARTLERAFERRRGRRGGVAVLELVGDAGSGKSSALTELAWRAQIAGAEVVRAGAEHSGGELGAAGACLQQLAALADVSVPEPGDGGEAGAFAATVARWLAELAERWPVVMVLDDLDQADALSRDLAGLLSFAMPDTARVLIVASTRRAALSSEVVELEPLSLGDVDGLLARAAGRRDLRLAARVHGHTGGNLSHVVHTLEALARRRFPPADALDGISLPASLDDELAESYGAQGERERSLCEVLAILGRPAEARLCAAVIERDAEELAAIPGLVERDGEVVRLARPSLRTVALRDVSPERRRALHGAVAAALARAGGSPIEITMHRVRAGEVDDGDEIRAAIEALWDAGDGPAALALGEAACRQRARDRSLAVRVGELAQLAGDRDRASRLLEPLVDGDDELAARARLSLALSLDQAGDPGRAQALLEPLAEGGAVAAAAARQLAQLHIRRGRFADALAVVDRALAAGGADPHLVIAQAFARGILGRDAEAESVLDEVAERAAADGDRALAAAAWHYGARIAFAAGDYQSTRRRYQAALAAAEAIGDLARTGILRMNLAAMDFSFGDLAGSRRHYGSALSYLRAAGADTYEVIARRNFGHLLLELGAHERARRELAVARDGARRVGLPVHDIGIGALLGLSAWRSGDLARGRDELEEARRRFDALGDARRVSETTLDLVELELDAAGLDPARLDHAEVLLAEVEGLAATTEDTARRGRFLVLSAELSARRGELAAARHRLEALEGVFAELERQGARQLEWDLRRLAAATWERVGEGARAVTQRRGALALLETMSRDLGEADRIAFWQDPRRRGLRAPSTPSAASSSVTSLAPTALAHENERLYRLLEIYRRLSSERDVPRLLAQVMETAVELCRSERGFLLLADERTGELRCAVTHNLPRTALGALERADTAERGGEERPYSRSIAETVFATGEAVVSRDARVDPRFDEARSVHALHVESVVCVPVHARGRVLGALYLEGLSRRSALGDDELRLLMAFGDQVAILLENARLLAENQRRTAELDAARAEIEGLLAERTELLELRTAELAGARRDLAQVSRRFLGASGAFGIVGRSPAMEKVFQALDRLAATDVPVLVLGESGTGKELVARALHQNGSRHAAPLVTVNCGALPETLLESELFGHERGAFTGADRRRAGLFETADRGTLFLDEVGETPPRMQAQLLRALQEQVVRRVGGVDDLHVDVRLVAATNRDLEELVAEGAFREDLYYRLHVVPIVLPPLRERDGDVPLLVEHFLALIASRSGVAQKSITRRALAMLAEHPWPGNVRQLEHALTSAAVMADGEVLDLDDLAPVLAASDGARRSKEGPEDRRDAERERILEALAKTGWNKSQAARELGMPRRTFYRRLDEYDIQ